jgi:AraC-like DNA-binding protein
VSAALDQALGCSMQNVVGHKYRDIRWGVDRLPPNLMLPRHRHREGYANVVLSGSFVEASFAGRFRVEPGDVLLHASFDCHSNSDTGALEPTILRLPWDEEATEGRLRVQDPDLLARLAERDPREALLCLKESIEPGPPGGDDWPALLAADIAANPSLQLTHWARSHGLAQETVSRGFFRTFGVNPRLFRLEARTRMAWRAVRTSSLSLTAIAHDHGFADLAHMTRNVRLLTGLTPSGWRRFDILKAREPA